MAAYLVRTWCVQGTELCVKHQSAESIACAGLQATISLNSLCPRAAESIWCCGLDGSLARLK